MFTPEVLLQALASGIIIGCVYALIAVGLSLIFGVVDIVNFAHGEFLMLGMYATFWAYAILHLDPLVSVPLSAALLFLAGVLTHKLLIRKVLNSPQAIQMFSTFGLLVFIRSSAQFLWSGDFRFVTNPIAAGRFDVFGVFLGRPQVIAAVVAALTCGALFWFIERTQTGRALQAVSEDREAAALMGINVERMYTLAWGISCASVGVAGAMLTMFHYVYPDVGGGFLTISFVVVALSGFGSVTGALFGGLIVGVIEVFAGLLVSPALKDGVTFLVFIAVLTIRPQGLFGKQ